MSDQAILDKITEIMRDLTEDDALVLTRKTTADDVELWDSLLHVHLIIAIESAYKIHFETKEIETPGNVGELIDMIQSKLAA
jgi:acyl carrier protein